MRINVIFLMTLWFTAEGRVEDIQRYISRIPTEDYFSYSDTITDSQSVTSAESQTLFGMLRELCEYTEPNPDINAPKLPDDLTRILRQIADFFAVYDQLDLKLPKERFRFDQVKPELPNAQPQPELPKVQPPPESPNAQLSNLEPLLRELFIYLKKHEEVIEQLPNHLIALVKVELNNYFQRNEELSINTVPSGIRTNIFRVPTNVILDYEISSQATSEITKYLSKFIIGSLKNILQNVDVNSIAKQVNYDTIGCSERLTKQILGQEWEEFKIKYEKLYRSVGEERTRRIIFEENTIQICLFNEQYRFGNKLFYLRMNSFGDKRGFELARLLNGLDPSKHQKSNITFIPCENVNLPESVDWRQKGAVTPVKNQELCSSCWAFSAAGALEGQHYRKTGRLENISAQNILDCVNTGNGDQCEKDYMTNAFKTILNLGGVERESAAPYTKKEQDCQVRRKDVVTDCTGHVDIPPGDEHKLAVAVATHGPVSAGIYISNKTTFEPYFFYADGTYHVDNCPNGINDLTHGILIVGYGRNDTSHNYWLIKNSYGPEWGIYGYFKMMKDAYNHCGIATLASYPFV